MPLNVSLAPPPQEREMYLSVYRRLGAKGHAEMLAVNFERVNFFPELLPELDDQLRRMAEGQEPFNDPLGNAMALYRTGQPADRAAAEALLRAAGLWEKRQKEVRIEQCDYLKMYRKVGAERYAALLQGDAYLRAQRAFPELLPELDDQLRRMAEGLEPFQDPVGKANELYHLGSPPTARPPQMLCSALRGCASSGRRRSLSAGRTYWSCTARTARAGTQRLQ
eukprot:TRINITY_DN1392_c0_g2_i2.p2 TRINITY_DN1392_c0_g2~~TRINITY_DN1392_c0_g2_i2.p2  ORF type:complete len:256 (+),score=63.85 TRINITY_DN1392_c0_g2_i2:100-768(+)